MVETSTVESTDTVIVPFEDTDDPLHRTHVIDERDNKHLATPGMTPQDIVDAARMLGVEVTALCGYKFIPKANPDKYGICDPCLRLARSMMDIG